MSPVKMCKCVLLEWMVLCLHAPCHPHPPPPVLSAKFVILHFKLFHTSASFGAFSVRFLLWPQVPHVHNFSAISPKLDSTRYSFFRQLSPPPPHEILSGHQGWCRCALGAAAVWKALLSCWSGSALVQRFCSEQGNWLILFFWQLQQEIKAVKKQLAEKMNLLRVSSTYVEKVDQISSLFPWRVTRVSPPPPSSPNIPYHLLHECQQCSYRVLLKSTCAFLCFFLTSHFFMCFFVLFFWPWSTFFFLILGK